MEYSESKAKELQRKYSLKNSTIERWRKRGIIPKKYSEENKSKFLINGYTLRECRAKIKKHSYEVLSDIKEQTGFIISNTLLSYWENGVYTPRENYQNLLKDYYAKRLQEAQE